MFTLRRIRMATSKAATAKSVASKTSSKETEIINASCAVKEPNATKPIKKASIDEPKEKNGCSHKKIDERTEMADTNPISCDVTTASSKTKKSTQKEGVTRVVVKFDCGFANSLFLRGEGIASLSWEKGLPLKNIKSDEWVWETDRPFAKAQFKVLINDKAYEVGENHSLKHGETLTCTPKF
jgi:hypothetical protein